MEAVRLSYGLSARNPRTRKTVMRYGGWVVPAGTNVVCCVFLGTGKEGLIRMW